MKKTNITYYSIVAIALLSCKGTIEKGYYPIIDIINCNETTPITDIIDKDGIEFITSDSVIVIDMADDMNVNGFLFTNFFSTQMPPIFMSRDGSSVKTIGFVGRGPHEFAYPDMLSSCLNGDDEVIIVQRDKMLVDIFDIDGTFKREIHLEDCGIGSNWWNYEVIALDGYCYLFSLYSNPSDLKWPSPIWCCFDLKNGKLVNQEKAKQKQEDNSTTDTGFYMLVDKYMNCRFLCVSPYKDHLIYRETSNDTIYSIDKNGKKPLYVFNTGNSNNPNYSKESVWENVLGVPSAIIETKEWILVYGKKNYCYNKKSGKLTEMAFQDPGLEFLASFYSNPNSPGAICHFLNYFYDKKTDSEYLYLDVRFRDMMLEACKKSSIESVVKAAADIESRYDDISGIAVTIRLKK